MRFYFIKVERVEVKDVRLPVQLQRAMATEAEAAREARAKVRQFALKLFQFKTNVNF
jgi:regulator of protease activity HflC (stomatin/prohibitin superfamily)